eukprot:1188693-Prorocentrum_minimum.AAC.3
MLPCDLAKPRGQSQSVYIPKKRRSAHHSFCEKVLEFRDSRPSERKSYFQPTNNSAPEISHRNAYYIAITVVSQGKAHLLKIVRPRSITLLVRLKFFTRADIRCSFNHNRLKTSTHRRLLTIWNVTKMQQLV